MKRGSIPPTFVFPAIAVGLLALAFLYYYFPARIRREEALNHQAFRQLGTVADLIQNAVSNYGTVLERWAKANSTNDLEGFTDQVPDLHYVAVTTDTAENLRVGTHSEPGHVLLWFQYGRHGADIPLETVVQRYIQGDPEETFDEFLVADGSGAVLFQTRRTGLHLRNLSALPGAPRAAGGGDKQPSPDKPAAAAQQASDVVKVSLGGSDYRLYSSPAPIRVRRADTTPALDLVLYGLVSETSVHSRALVTPGSLQITIGLMVALVICIAWPLLKFRTMRASERVPRGAGLYFFVTSIITIVLLMILTIHLWYRVADFDHTQEKLERLAEAIDNNVTREARQALDALSQAMASDHFRKAAGNLQANSTACGVEPKSPYTITEQAGDVLKRRDFPVAGYPYFDQMFWADGNGFQQIKWTVRSHPTPATRLCQYPFFTETLEGHLWYFEDGGPAQSRFRIDPLYSPNTGEYQAVISQPYVQREDLPGRPLAMTAMVTQMLSLIHPVAPPDYGFAMVDESGTVLFHSTAERNGREQLFDEVDNDPAVRAAVYARTGGHLITNYHGAPHRFFVRPLRSIQGCPWTLAAFRDLRPLSALQLERTILFLVLSVGYLLLVGLFAAIFIRFQDYPLKWLWPQASMNALYVHTALSLIILAALLYVVVIRAPLLVSFLSAVTAPVVAIRVIAWKLQGRALRIRWLAYILLAAVVGVVALSIAWMRDLRWWQVGPLLLGACLALQFCASRWVTAWIAKNRRTGEARSLPDFSSSYTAMALSLLLLVPALPCVSFFRIAYDYHENIFTRQAQLQTMAALEDRVERVRRAYRQVKLTDVSLTDGAGKINDVARALFLRGRIDDVRLDRYDTVFAAGGGQEYSPRPRESTGARAGSEILQDSESRFWAPLQVLASLWRDPYTSGARFLNGRDDQSTRWSWTPEGDRHLRLRPRFVPSTENASADSPPTAALARLVASNPVLLSEDLVSELQALQPGFWEAAIPLAVIGWLMYLLFRSTIARMFLLHVNFDAPWPETSFEEAIAADHNLILVGLPRTGKTVMLEELRKAGKIYHIDLAELAPKWLAAESQQVHVQRNEIAEPAIVLDHFEYNCQDPEVNRVKLEILEWLAHAPGKRVLIVTAIDPAFYLHPGPLDDAGSPEGFAPGKYLDRWMAILAGFDLKRLPPPTAQRNGYYYQLLWAVCSRSERVALYQLARYGWPNHQNWRALNHLLKRGLIERTPVIRIADEGFRNHIRTVVGQKDVTIWERDESITVWDGVRIAFYILAVGAVVAVSVYHQQQVLAVITTLLGVVPALGKVFRDSLGRSADKAAKGGASE